jgi:hypothetical protein
MFYDVGDTPDQRNLSGLPVACPVCRRVHERCVCTTGSVYCTGRAAGSGTISYHLGWNLTPPSKRMTSAFM